jgi:prolyl 4-hydroxylase
MDEPCWPIEVIGHDWVAVNITMAPGGLILYKLHSILHGCPFPLKGHFFANPFIHFEASIGPVGEAFKIDGDAPQYVVRGSEEEQSWLRQNPNGYELYQAMMKMGATSLHQAAANGDTANVKKLLQEKAHLVNVRDVNGWMPIHVSSWCTMHCFI